MGTIGTKDKKEIVDDFKLHDKDVGSTDIQVAILTERINYLVEHLKEHKKDHHTRRGLLILVNRRKKLLKYLLSKDYDKYLKLCKKLKLKA